MLAGAIDIPDAVISAQQAGELVIFAGAGVSQGPPSDLPGFLDLVQAIAERTNVAVDPDMLDVTLGRVKDTGVDVHTECRERIRKPSSRPNEIHRLLLRLFPEPKHLRLVTTNFDSHFATAAKEMELNIREYHAPALPLGHDFRGLVHLHGSIEEEPRTMVLTDEDFGRAYLSEGWARTFLQSLLTSYTVLFVGYSHNDPPVRYLARGMSSRGMNPRFAFTSKREAALWTPLGIKPVFYPVVDEDHSALNQGIAHWIEIIKRQPLEVEEALRRILTAPEDQAPDRSQTDFIRRCLTKADTARYFVQHAHQWRWIEWLHEERLLRPLLECKGGDDTDPTRILAHWASRKLVHDDTGRGLWLLDEDGGRLGFVAWHAAAQELWVAKDIDFSKPGHRHWLVVIADPARHQVHVDLLGYLLGKLAEAQNWDLAIYLLGVLLTPRIRLADDFRIVFEPNRLQTAEPELRLLGDGHELSSAWYDHFVPKLSSLAPALLPLLEDRLRAAERLLLVIGSDARRLIYGRRHIASRLHPYDRDSPAVLLDYLVDVVDVLAGSKDPILDGKAREWMASGSPALLRLGLHVLSLVPSISAGEKVDRILHHDLLYPNLDGAREEIESLLKSVYKSLTDDERRHLWAAIEAGPSAQWSRDLKPDEVGEIRAHEINRLVARLSGGQSDAPATEARARLNVRAPKFDVAREPDEHDGVIVESTDRSPVSIEDLLAKPPEEQIEFLLEYKGNGFLHSTDGLAAAVSTAASRNIQWAEELLHALEQKDAWQHPIWNRVFWQLEWKKLPPVFQLWLVQTVLAHWDKIEDFGGPARLVFDGETFELDRIPSPELLEKMLELSVTLWPRLIAQAHKTEKSDLDEDWTSRAINSAEGRIVGFWLHYVDHSRPDRRVSPREWPPRLAPFFDEMAVGGSYGAKLGLAIIAQQLGFVRFIAPEWTRAKLFPLLDVATQGDRSFVVWKPFLFYGRFNRDLILELPPYFQKSFGRFAEVEDKLAKRFTSYVAIIVHSRLWEIHRCGWLDEFLRSMPMVSRVHWAQEIGRFLQDTPPEDRRVAWSVWIKLYWEERNRGRPCRLDPSEAEAMATWVLALLDVVPEIWPLAEALPFDNAHHGHIFWSIDKTKLPEEHPAELVGFLVWILPRFQVLHEMRDTICKFVDRMPPKATLQSGLLQVAQELRRLGFAGASELAEKIRVRFVE